jgi:propanol-preferring alcohol dehydrogenase
VKAAQLHKVGKIETSPLQIDEIERPVPKRGQILVKIEAAGICRSNLHMVEGEWVHLGVPTKYPMIPGHEIAGRVAEVGEGVTSVKKDGKVGVSPLWTSCGSCEYCLTGREQLCWKRDITGETVDGGFAQYMIANEGHIYPLPEELDPVEAAPLFCPGVTAYGAIKKVPLGPGKKLAVFGIGGVGHMALRYGKLYGSDVYAVTRSDLHLALSEELGATPIDAKKDPVGQLNKLGGVDASIVFAPSSDVAMQAVKATKRDGTIVLGAWGGVPDFPFYDEKKVVGTLMGSRQVMREVISLAVSHKMLPVTQTYPLAEVNEAMRELKQGEVRARAVLRPWD